MRAYKLHLYPQLPCPLPHRSFREDFVQIQTYAGDEEKVSLFINMHATDYLRALISKVPTLLHDRLRLNRAIDDRHTCVLALKNHFRLIAAQPAPHHQAAQQDLRASRQEIADTPKEVNTDEYPTRA